MVLVLRLVSNSFWFYKLGGDTSEGGGEWLFKEWFGEFVVVGLICRVEVVLEVENSVSETRSGASQVGTDSGVVGAVTSIHFIGNISSWNITSHVTKFSKSSSHKACILSALAYNPKICTS